MGDDKLDWDVLAALDEQNAGLTVWGMWDNDFELERRDLDELGATDELPEKWSSLSLLPDPPDLISEPSCEWLDDVQEDGQSSQCPDSVEHDGCEE